MADLGVDRFGLWDLGEFGIWDLGVVGIWDLELGI
jgi:hypothetical protein